MNVSRGRAAWIFCLALIVGVLSYAVGVGSLLGQRAEASVLDASDFTVHPPAPLSLISTPSVIISLIAIALIAWWSSGFLRALTMVCAAAIAIVASQLLKQDLLVRPDLFELDAKNSFPSGHMTVFAALVAGLIWAVPRASAPLVALFGSSLLGVVAWQLLEYGWHRPSDVLGALALALMTFSLAAIVVRRSRLSSVTSHSRALSAVHIIMMIIITISGTLVTIGGIVLSVAAGWVQSDELLLKGAQLALVGASVLVTRLFLAVRP